MDIILCPRPNQQDQFRISQKNTGMARTFFSGARNLFRVLLTIVALGGMNSALQGQPASRNATLLVEVTCRKLVDSRPSSRRHEEVLDINRTPRTTPSLPLVACLSKETQVAFRL